KYYKWLINCKNIINDNIKERQRKLTTFTICSCLEKKKRSYTNKRFWVNPLFELRKKHGFYNVLLPTISRQISTFRNYFRMNLTQFEELSILLLF
ncbi:hypothetical protein ALC62_01200, partial [Cyphomyrmex costatus]